MPAPSTPFANDFRALIVPRLRRVCLHHGLEVALGLTGFVDAEAAVWGEAWRLGASHLPEEQCLDLEDWVARTLLTAIGEHETRIAAHRAAMAHVHADVTRWNSAVIHRFSKAANVHG